MRLVYCAAIALSACFTTVFPNGAPCDPSRDNCPIGQTCQATGSGSFCGVNASSQDAGRDGAVVDAAPSRITYVGPFVQDSPGTGASGSFTTRAHAVGNAVVLQVSCNASAVPTAVSVTAAGWTFMQLGPITAAMGSSERSATFVAIAPDAADTTVTVNWSGSTCSSSKNEVGDEFAMTDATGGAMTFDGSNVTQGTGNCVGTVTTGHAGDAVWAACDSDNKVTAVGSGFTKGADDRAGDWSEYMITNHPAGTVEAVEFANADVGYVLSMVTLKSQ